MTRNDAIEEFRDMWTWLYSHPAHDRRYYIKYVAKPDPAWKNECPICGLTEEECKECLTIWDNGNGTLCEDRESPLNLWQNTNQGDPDFRMWYAGKLVALASKALE